MITRSTNDGKIGYSGEVYYIAMITRSTNDGKIGYSGEVYYIAMITRSTNDGKSVIVVRFTILQWSLAKPMMEGAQWLSGRVLDSRPKGSGFEPHRRHCVVVLEQDTFILA